MALAEDCQSALENGDTRDIESHAMARATLGRQITRRLHLMNRAQAFSRPDFTASKCWLCNVG